MRRIAIVLGIAALILAVLAGWRIGACELANANLQEDLQDLASQAGIHVGLVTPTSDEDVRLAVIRKAKDHGIELESTQVTVRRANPGATSTLYLAADYTVQLNLLFFSFNLHFNPSSDKKGM